MRKVFLGRVIHWAIIFALCLFGWIAGRYRLHVTEFNFFVGLLILTVVVVIVALIRTSRPDEKVTRDPLVDERTHARPVAPPTRAEQGEG